jgi:hypothetical protein
MNSENGGQALPDHLIVRQSLTSISIKILHYDDTLSAANTENCEQEKTIPLPACGRKAHHHSPEDRFADAGKAPTASAVTRMRHRLKTPEGKTIYAKRKSTVEPVFGVIKQVMGFRQFLLRGLDAGLYWLQFEAARYVGRIGLPKG